MVKQVTLEALAVNILSFLERDANPLTFATGLVPAQRG
jgi:hypothetical protein